MLAYTESVTAHYQMMQQQRSTEEHQQVHYKNEVAVNEQKNCIKADIKAITSDPI